MSTRVHSAPSKRAKGKAPAQQQQQQDKQQPKQQQSASPSTTAPAASSSAGKKPTHARTTVYRPLLASPFTVTWPTLSASEAEPLLYTLIECLAQQRVEVRAQKQQQQAASDAIEVDAPEEQEAQEQQAQEQAQEEPNVRPPWLHVGINAVNAYLEGLIASSVSAMHQPAQVQAPAQTEDVLMADDQEAQAQPQQSGPGAASSSSAAPPLPPSVTASSNPAPRHRMRYLFVCRADVDPPRLIAHLPMLACTANSVCDPLPVDPASNPSTAASTNAAPAQEGLYLLPLSREAEAKIAYQLKVRRCAALGISEDAPAAVCERFQTLFTTLRSRSTETAAASGSASGPIPSALYPLRAPWLDAAVGVVRMGVAQATDFSNNASSEATGAPASSAANAGSVEAAAASSNRAVAVTLGIPYRAPNIRVLQTSVPSDMNAARARKKDDRKARKAATEAKKKAEGPRAKANGAGGSKGGKEGSRKAKAAILGSGATTRGQNAAKDKGKGKDKAEAGKAAVASGNAKSKANSKSSAQGSAKAAKSAAGKGSDSSASTRLSDSQRRRLRRKRAQENSEGQADGAKITTTVAGRNGQQANGTKGGKAGAKAGSAAKGGDGQGKQGPKQKQAGPTAIKAPGAQQTPVPTAKKAATAKKTSKGGNPGSVAGKKIDSVAVAQPANGALVTITPSTSATSGLGKRKRIEADSSIEKGEPTKRSNALIPAAAKKTSVVSNGNGPATAPAP
ncbi:hypothetical protein V8E36_008847 [Tilletia maclaganii]